MAEVDRDDVTYVGRAVRPGGQRSQQAVNSAMRRGAPIDTSKKWAAGHNKQHVMDKNTAALDRETEELKHDKVTLDVARLIQQGRQAKGMSQKDLATKICEKPQIITEYETGKAIPSQQILSKIERAIGIKLRGKEKGQPMPVIVPSTSTTKK